MLEKFIKPKAEPTQYEIYSAELIQINNRISAVRREFELVSDSNLIEGLIFELESLSRRQSFLYEQLKCCDDTSVKEEAVKA